MFLTLFFWQSLFAKLQVFVVFYFLIVWWLVAITCKFFRKDIHHLICIKIWYDHRYQYSEAKTVKFKSYMLRKKMKNRVSLSATLSLPLLFFLKRKSDIRMANNRRISIKYPPDGDYPMDSRHRISKTQYPGGRYLAIVHHPVIRKTFLSSPSSHPYLLLSLPSWPWANSQEL